MTNCNVRMKTTTSAGANTQAGWCTSMKYLTLRMQQFLIVGDTAGISISWESQTHVPRASTGLPVHKEQLISDGEFNPCQCPQKKKKNQCRRIKTLSIISLQSVVSVKMYLLRKFALIYSIFPYFTQNTWYHAKLCSPKLWFVPSKKDLGLVQGGMRGHGARGVVVELGKNLNRLPYKTTRPM